MATATELAVPAGGFGLTVVFPGTDRHRRHSGNVPAALTAMAPRVSGRRSATGADAADITDPRAFGAVVERHQERVMAYCLRFLGDDAAARDVTQEVFLTLWREGERYEGVATGELRLVLLSIARNRCLAVTKRRRARLGIARRLSREPAGLAPPPDSAHEAAELVRRGIAHLKPKHADVVILRYLEELDLAEIATVTGLRRGTVKSRLSRALTLLRKELADA